MQGITVQEFFQSCYREAGMVPLEGTGLAPEQNEECRKLFNRMIDDWRSEGLTIYHVGRTLFDIIPGKGDYTIGINQDFDCPWPERITRAGFVLTGQTLDPEYEIYPLTVEEWADWTYKKQATNWSQRYYYEKSYPIGVMHLLYVPNDVNQLALYMEEPLQEINATGDQLFDLPPGYQTVCETNLGKAIAARNPGRSNISKLTLDKADSSLDQLRSNNRRGLKRSTDLSRGRNFRSNVYEGNRYTS